MKVIEKESRDYGLSSRGEFRLFKEALSRNKLEREDVSLKSDAESQRRENEFDFLRWRRLLRPHLCEMSWLFGLASLGVLISMVWPLVIKIIIDDIILPDGAEPAEKVRRIAVIGAGMIVLMILNALVGYYKEIRDFVLQARIVSSVRSRMFSRLIRTPLRTLDRTKVGSVISRLASDAPGVGGIVHSAVLRPGLLLLQIGTILGIVGYMNWRLTLLVLVFSVLILAVSYLWATRLRPIYREIRLSWDRYAVCINEAFSGIRIVRAFGREKREERKHITRSNVILRGEIHALKRKLILSGGWNLIMMSCNLLIACVGGGMVIYGGATMGELVSFQIYAFLLLEPANELVESMSAKQENLASIDRVFHSLDSEVEGANCSGVKAPPSEIRDIRFEGVCFEYTEGARLFEDLNLEIPGGTTIALVGKSGSGKTTFTNLIARFYEAQHGRVLINGEDISNFDLRRYREIVALVEQDTFLFDGTIYENIAYAVERATSEEVRAAARLANAEEFIVKMGSGYGTPVGERGVCLSGGQRQRIGIARAFLRNPLILIMDEATNNLDSESEKAVQDALQLLAKNRTTFIVAHRLSAVFDADNIIVLDSGKVVESGSHTELMDKTGIYWRMVQLQRDGLLRENVPPACEIASVKNRPHASGERILV